MVSFRRHSDDPEADAELGDEISGFADRLAAADERRSPQPLAAPTAPSPIAQVSDLDALRAEFQAELIAQLAAIAGRIDALDARVTSISTELANQLTELSTETDAAGAAAEAIRAGQAKLANEQARYQIAFREDLAALAERLKRG